jgi:hypothetical protein
MWMQTARPRARRGASVAVAALVIVGLIAVASFVAGRLFDWPFATSTVDRSPTPALLELADLAEYHAAVGEFQVLVDVEKDVRFVPEALAGERVLYIGVGSVDAVVDFTDLDDDAVRIDDDGAVTIVLSTPRLEQPVLDVEQSHVAGRDRGILDRLGGLFSDSPTGERDLQISATAKIADAAAGTGLVERAQENTEAMLGGLLGALGYDDVTVAWVDPRVP